MQKRFVRLTLGLSLVLSVFLLKAQAQVRMWEEPITIKTYIKGEPDPNPRFLVIGSGHQGVQRNVYPYPMDDVLTDSTAMKTYKAIYLENEYIKICIIPELGGRIFSAFDKVNNYEFIYRQVVIKPSLIGMVGSWISGAIAWGFPHHHGPETMAAFDYFTKENLDGSKTVWMSKLDLRHRMTMMIGITVAPDKSYIEASIELNNPTPYANSMLFWTNPSVKADSSYKIFFDPSVEWATYHQKTEFVKWPVADSIYSTVDYKGVNISLWKNIKRPSSFFSWNPQGDYFGGYSFENHAGIVYVGNHYIMPGMKIWEHGANPEGNSWRGLLTDNSDHYIELMAGAYSDNQPDYSWIEPYETKRFKQYWFPVGKIEGLDYANLNGALTLSLDNSNKVRIAINPTTNLANAKIVLEGKGRKLFEQITNLSPQKPYINNVEVSNDLKETDLRISLYSASGELLLSFQHPEKLNIPRPKTYTVPGDPKEFKTVEELYLAGLRIDQFYNPILNANVYFDEALRRDSCNYDVNTHIGINDCKHKLWKEAEKRLQTAANRVTYNYTRPKSCEALYYLGIALKEQGKTDKAYDAFYRATWDNAWHTAAYEQLGEIDCLRGDYQSAEDHFERAITTNNANVKLLTNHAIVLRKSGKNELAEKEITSITQDNTMDFFSRNELYLLLKQKDAAKAEIFLKSLVSLMRDDEESYIELATNYINIGLYNEAIDVLNRIDATKINGGSLYPMVYYIQGYLWNKKGENNKSIEYLKIASKKPYEYCFPFRDEEIKVLEYAEFANPSDAKAPYYLGCLLYDNDPQRAITEWEKSLAQDNRFSYVYRNLAWGYDTHEQNTQKAIEYLEKAIALNEKDPRFYYELDVLYEKNKTPIDKRLDMLSKHHSVVVKRNDALAREALVNIIAGNYDKALDIFQHNHFHYGEGVDININLFQDAALMKGILNYKAKKYLKALSDFRLSYSYPDNMERGRLYNNPRYAEMYFYTGIALDELGKKKQAKECYKIAAKENTDNTVYLYYQALAYKKLGNDKEAEISLEKLNKFNKEEIDLTGNKQFTVAVENENKKLAVKCYNTGMYYLAMGMKNEAKDQFTKAIQADPFHIWSGFMLKNGLN